LNKAVKDTISTEEDHCVGDQLSAGAGDARRLLKILGRSPDDGAENSSAVEWKSRQEIENGEGGIGTTQPGC